jgi:uncharacterized protein
VSGLLDAAAVCRLIEASAFHAAVLRAVRTIDLPDWWIGAGFVRNAVWDHLHGYAAPTPLNDIDVIWFDPSEAEAALDDRLTALLGALWPGLPWSVKNQARMHKGNGDPPYASAVDAMRYWPETATAVAVSLDRNDGLTLAAPFGVTDLASLTLRPTPHCRAHRLERYRERLERKGWLATWPKLRSQIEPDG